MEEVNTLKKRLLQHSSLSILSWYDIVNKWLYCMKKDDINNVEHYVKCITEPLAKVERTVTN